MTISARKHKRRAAAGMARRILSIERKFANDPQVQGCRTVMRASLAWAWSTNPAQKGFFSLDSLVLKAQPNAWLIPRPGIQKRR